MVSDRVTSAALILIHVAVVVASLAGPALILADTVHSEEHGRWSFAAWRNVFGSSEAWSRWIQLLSNTMSVCGSAVGLCCLAGTALALVLFKTDARFRPAAIALLLLAAALPIHVVNGSMLSIIGVERAQKSAVMVGLIHAIAHLPIVVLIIGVAVRSVAAELEEVALVEGAGRLRVLLRVTLRSAVGGTVASVILVVLWAATDYSVSDVLQVRTFAEEVYTQSALWGRPQEAALACVPQVALFGVLLWVLRRGYIASDPPALSSGRRRRFMTGRWRTLLSIVAGAACLALAATPIASLVPRLERAKSVTQLAWSFSEEIRVSMVASLAAGVISAGLGVGLAWYAVRRRRWRAMITGYVVAMLAIPAPILGMGMIRLFNRPGFWGNHVYDSPVILVLAYVFRFLPIAVILLIPTVRAVPRECEMAARVDGCGMLGTWRRIVWPMCLPGALVAMFVVMVLSLGELPCSLLVAPPGYVTAGTRFFSLIHYGLYPDAAMLCLLSMAMVAVPWLGLLVLWRRQLAE